MNPPYFFIKGIVQNTHKRSNILKKSYPHYMILVLAGNKTDTASINLYLRVSPCALSYYVFHNHSSTISNKVTNLDDGIYQNHRTFSHKS